VRYALVGNMNTPINSVRNLQRKFNRQYQRMMMLDVWSQVFGAKKDV
jgi:hypothetical protein